MEDQAHKPHRKSKEKKEKNKHTGGKCFSELEFGGSQQFLYGPDVDLWQSAIPRRLPSPSPASFRNRLPDHLMYVPVPTFFSNA